MMYATKLFAVVFLLFGLLFGSTSNVAAKITAQQIAIVINTQDADSRLIANYYQNKRGIPQENLIKVSMPAGSNSISEAKFNEIYQQIKKQTPGTVQYYALAWSKPFKVACMSITSAVAFGFDKAFWHNERLNAGVALTHWPSNKNSV